MECPKQQKYDYNLYAKDLKPEGNLFQFNEFCKHTSKKGKEIDVLSVAGAITTKEGKHIVGDFRIPLFNISNYDDFAMKLKDITSVENLMLTISPNGEELKILVA